MPTHSERRALILVTVVVALGVVARVGRANRATSEPTPAERRALDLQIARVESARAGQRGAHQGVRAPRPQAALGPIAGDTSGKTHTVPVPRVTMRRASSRRPAVAVATETAPRRPIDLDVATVAQLEGLPYVGHVLAARIVASRELCGAFGSIDALKRVQGVGDGLSRRLAPLVTFSGTSRPMSAVGPPGCATAEKRAAVRPRDRP
jgi:DNA uptake protein ComE-like DNA-binding protein